MQSRPHAPRHRVSPSALALSNGDMITPKRECGVADAFLDEHHKYHAAVHILLDVAVAYKRNKSANAQAERLIAVFLGATREELVAIRDAGTPEEREEVWAYAGGAQERRER